ncbi:MAG TPA: DUF5989 family protein [Verrucomicrobiae bacterium]|nr:DUF5989 family protein [Verrucomicrobiae bacterium]
MSIVKEFWSFLKERKKYWIMPIVFFLLVLGFVLVVSKGSALAPFIYSIF